MIPVQAMIMIRTAETSRNGRMLRLILVLSVRFFGGEGISHMKSIVSRSTWNAPIPPATEKPTKLIEANAEVKGVLLLWRS